MNKKHVQDVSNFLDAFTRTSGDDRISPLPGRCCISLSALNREYRLWCKEREINPKGALILARAMRELGFTSEVATRQKVTFFNVKTWGMDHRLLDNLEKIKDNFRKETLGNPLHFVHLYEKRCKYYGVEPIRSDHVLYLIGKVMDVRPWNVRFDIFHKSNVKQWIGSAKNNWDSDRQKLRETSVEKVLELYEQYREDCFAAFSLPRTTETFLCVVCLLASREDDPVKINQQIKEIEGRDEGMIQKKINMREAI